MTQIGNDLPNTLLGSGIDTLIALGANDNLSGSQDGKGLMNGNQGDDTLRSRAPEDTMYGGQGNDVLVSSGGSLMFGDLGNDTLVGESTTSVFGGGLGGSDTMNGGDGNDSLVAAPGGNSILYGNAGNDTLVAKNRQDTLFGGQGDDCLEVGSFALLAYGDLGNDKIIATGSTGGATLFGGSSDIDKNDEDGNDTINSGGGNLVFGNGGNDVLNGSTGDTIRGGQDNDTITAAGAQVFGDLGNDVISVSGNSTVDGGAGSDTLTATGSGNMLMDGGSVANTFILGADATDNLVKLGSGTIAQTVNALASGSGNTIDGATSSANNTISSDGGNYIILGSGTETVTATPQDTVEGVQTGDVILGGAFQIASGATSSVLGSNEPESLLGGSGSDTIEGLGGSDTLTGGAGADVFLFRGNNFSAINSVTFTGSTLVGTDRVLNYGYGLTPSSDALVPGQTFGGAAGVIPTIGTGGFLGTAAAQVNYSTNPGPALQFEGGGTAAFISGTLVVGNTLFSVDPSPLESDRFINVLQGGTVGAIAGAVFARVGTDTSTPGGTFAAVGYGYSSSGFDVITDFADGTDKIAISASLLGNLSLGAGGIAIGTASASLGAFERKTMAYDSSTGILYFIPGGTANAAQIGTVPTYQTTGSFAQATFGTFAGGNPGINALGTVAASAFGTGGIDTNNTPATFEGNGTTFVQTRYTFAPTGSTVIGIQDGAGGVVPTSGTALPIPFLQILNGGSPVTATIDLNDITLF